MQERCSLSARPVGVPVMRRLKDVQLTKNAQEQLGAQAWQVRRRGLAYYIWTKSVYFWRFGAQRYRRFILQDLRKPLLARILNNLVRISHVS
jgi:hypothetical protein